MKNSLLIITLLVSSIFGLQTNFSLKEKPTVNYIINNTFPAISGDTINIDFFFESQYDLKYFMAKIDVDLDINTLAERVDFIEGRKNGTLNYSFIIPDKCKLENLLNFNFTLADKYSSENVFVAIPIYNPPHSVVVELENGNNEEEIFAQSFFSSKNLILTNELLADIAEVEGYSDFTVDELENFSIPKTIHTKSQIINREIIASNLIIPSGELVKNDDELIAANFLSVPINLNENIEISDFKNVIKNIKPVDSDIIDQENRKTKILMAESVLKKNNTISTKTEELQKNIVENKENIELIAEVKTDKNKSINKDIETGFENKNLDEVNVDENMENEIASINLPIEELSEEVISQTKEVASKGNEILALSTNIKTLTTDHIKTDELINTEAKLNNLQNNKISTIQNNFEQSIGELRKMGLLLGQKLN